MVVEKMSVAHLPPPKKERLTLDVAMSPPFLLLRVYKAPFPFGRNRRRESHSRRCDISLFCRWTNIFYHIGYSNIFTAKWKRGLKDYNFEQNIRDTVTT